MLCRCVLTFALAAPCLRAAELPRFEHLGKLTQARLNNEILNSELKSFAGNPGMWPGYAMPTYAPATNDVDIYRVTYQSTIPEQHHRKITAYGLIAVPAVSGGKDGAPTRYPLVSYQHGTVYGKHEVPSDSFGTNYGQYAGAYETRLNVAEFAGNGYVVIAADYFGMGASTEPEGYTVKGSQQQACLDLYRCAEAWLKSRNVTVSELFVAGWSQGGLVTLDFLEKLENEGIPVKAASTASAPADPFTAASAWLFHPRDGKDGNTADAVWVNTVLILTAFSYQNYYSNPGLTAEVFDPRYLEAYRKVYTREYTNVTYTTDGKSMIVDGVTTPTKPLEMFKAKYQEPGAFSKSEYAGYLRDVSAYRWYVRTPLRMYCGMQDEAFGLNIAHLPHEYQACFQPGRIEVVDVASATHRGTFLTAVAGQKVWFDKLRAAE
jgi:pimeloyl-ACP methyl ester carboxylesterase